MSMSRRTMLKGVVVSSAVSTLASCQQRVSRSGPCVSPATAAPDEGCFVNFLLHGGFFVDFQPSGIVVKAPAVDMHKYAIGSQGFLTELYRPAAQRRLPPTIPHPTDIAVDMDWTTLISGLTPGTVQKLDDYKAIPKFSATDTKVGNMNGPYRWQIALPFPKEVIPLRLGKLSEFNRWTKAGRVKDSVSNLCKNENDQLALIVCLRYQKRREYCFDFPVTVTYSLYAEHDHETTTGEMNETLKQMATVFEHPENFDLQVTDVNAAPPVQPDNDKCEKGITGADEKSLQEILTPVGTASRVTSCLCISYCDGRTGNCRD